MDRTTLSSEARRHWEQWLPRKVKELRESGEYQQALQTAARLAKEEIAALMRKGYQQHESEEVALPQFSMS